MSNLIEQMWTQVETWEKEQDDRAIFLTCYSMMTDNMLKTVSAGGFEDGAWVASLTHCFADYYFDALKLYEADQKPPVWTFTFETACRKRAHVMQNLLLGVNAHICYDLIFAVADSIEDEWNDLSKDERQMRYRDYTQVNEVIGATLDAVQDSVVESRSRFMIFVDDAFGRLDEWMIHSMITRWRDQVWHQSITYLNTPKQDRLTLKQDFTDKADQRARAIRGQRGILGIVDLF